MFPWMKLPLCVQAMARSGGSEVPTAKLAALVATPPRLARLIWPEVAPVGTVAVRFVVELIVKGALTPLKVTLVTKPRFVPEMVTVVLAMANVVHVVLSEIATGTGGDWNLRRPQML